MCVSVRTREFSRWLAKFVGGFKKISAKDFFEDETHSLLTVEVYQYFQYSFCDNESHDLFKIM